MSFSSKTYADCEMSSRFKKYITQEEESLKVLSFPSQDSLTDQGVYNYLKEFSKNCDSVKEIEFSGGKVTINLQKNRDKEFKILPFENIGPKLSEANSQISEDKEIYRLCLNGLYSQAYFWLRKYKINLSSSRYYEYLSFLRFFVNTDFPINLSTDNQNTLFNTAEFWFEKKKTDLSLKFFKKLKNSEVAKYRICEIKELQSNLEKNCYSRIGDLNENGLNFSLSLRKSYMDFLLTRNVSGGDALYSLNEKKVPKGYLRAWREFKVRWSYFGHNLFELIYNLDHLKKHHWVVNKFISKLYLQGKEKEVLSLRKFKIDKLTDQTHYIAAASLAHLGELKQSQEYASKLIKSSKWKEYYKFMVSGQVSCHEYFELSLRSLCHLKKSGEPYGKEDFSGVDQIIVQKKFNEKISKSKFFFMSREKQKKSDQFYAFEKSKRESGEWNQ